MSAFSDLPTAEGTPTYLRRGDAAGRFADYRPAWVAKLARDVVLEGSLLDGAIQGAEAVRTVIGAARQLYDRQDFNFVGAWDDNSFIEDYTAEIRGVMVGAIHLIRFNAEGEAQNVIVNYRPLSSLMFFSRLLRKQLAGTPYAEHYLAGEA